MPDFDNLLRKIEERRRYYISSKLIKEIYSLINHTNLNNHSHNTDTCILCKPATKSEYSYANKPTDAVVCVNSIYLNLWRSFIINPEVSIVSEGMLQKLMPFK